MLPALVRVLRLRQDEIAAAADLDRCTLNRALAGKQRLSPHAIARVEAAILRHLSDGPS